MRSSLKRGRRTGPASFKRVKQTRTKKAQPRASVGFIKPRYEVKVKQNDSDGQVIVSTNQHYSFNFGLINNGDDEDERIGKLIRHLDYDFSFMLGTPASFPNGSVRLILGTVSGKYALASPTDILDVIDSWASIPGNAFNILRGYDPDTTKSFKIHHDQIYNLNSGTTNNIVSGDSAPVIKCYQLPTIRVAFDQEYNGTSDTDVGNMKHFGIFIASDASDISTIWSSQCRYVDI